MIKSRAIKEIEAHLRTIHATADKWVKEPHMAERELSHGLQVSRNATEQPSELPMTPIMKNMLRDFGDITEGERLKTGSPLTKAEKWLFDTEKLLLLQQGGKQFETYNVHLPLLDKQHYFVDCWLNLDINKFRDIGEGQVEEVNSVITDYSRPTKAIGLHRLMDNDLQFNKAIEVVAEHLPQVSATRKIVEINVPFMTKHTNVGFVPGYEGFGNDRTRVPGTNKTYGQLTMDIAETLKEHPELLWKYNITTEFTRYQRQKGRLINATARIINLVLNQLESIEIQNYKVKSPLFAGYNDDVYLKRVLREMTDFCENQGYVMYNIDYHRFDIHDVRELVELVGAVSMYRCVDERSRKLALYRACLMTRTWLIAGTLGRKIEVFGRIFSGFIDTNRAGGVLNAISMLYLVMKQDDHYVRDIVARILHWMLVMGDDNLVIVNPAKFSLSRLQADAKKLGHEIDDPSKLAFGPKFLQYRLFLLNGNYVMAYPWTRVLRATLFKERSKGLGPCGWTLTFYQQLAKLIEVPEFLAPVVNITAYFDDDHLMLDRSVEEIIKGAEVEDQAAIESGKRTESTARSLYDGDPSKARQFNESGDKLAPNYFAEVQQVIKSVYSTDYLKQHGITAPPHHVVKQ